MAQCPYWGCGREGVPQTKEELEEAGFNTSYFHTEVGAVRCGLHNIAKNRMRGRKAAATRLAKREAQRARYRAEAERLSNAELVDALTRRWSEPDSIRDSIQRDAYQNEAFRRLREVPS